MQPDAKDMLPESDSDDDLSVSSAPIVQEPTSLHEFVSKNATDEVFDAALKEGKASTNTLKMVLMGQGRAGKTSLWKALCDRTFDAKEETTHGVNARQIVTTRFLQEWKALESGCAVCQEEAGAAQWVAQELRNQLGLGPVVKKIRSREFEQFVYEPDGSLDRRWSF